jgi:hypothetical protein
LAVEVEEVKLHPMVDMVVAGIRKVILVLPILEVEEDLVMTDQMVVPVVLVSSLFDTQYK